MEGQEKVPLAAEANPAPEVQLEGPVAAAQKPERLLTSEKYTLKHLKNLQIQPQLPNARKDIISNLPDMRKHLKCPQFNIDVF